MQEQEFVDVVSLLQQLFILLQPFAVSRQITLEFTSTEKSIHLFCRESELKRDFSKLIRTLFDYMPAFNTVYITTGIIKINDDEFVSIKIHNTGINLKQVLAITNNISIPVSIDASIPKETTYEITYAISPGLNNHHPANNTNLNYLNVVRGIQSHFSKLNNPVERLAEKSPKEAAFLVSINRCIELNMVNEFFDANALSDVMCMSRAQLLRRLKSLTGASPAYYIKTLRLEKARVLLETADLSISEIAYKTGFNSPSHFAKVFNERFGIQPSMFRRPKPSATNE